MILRVGLPSDSRGVLNLLACAGPGPWEKLIETIVRPQIDETREDVGEVGMGLYVVELAALDERSQDCPILASVVMACK